MGIEENKTLSSSDRMGADPTLGPKGCVTGSPLRWGFWILFGFLQEVQIPSSHSTSTATNKDDLNGPHLASGIQYSARQYWVARM